MSLSEYRQSTLSTLAPLIDGLIVGLAGWLAYFSRWGKWHVPADYVSVITLGTALVLIALPAGGAYQSWRGEIHWRNTGNTLPGLFAVAVILMIVGTLTKTSAEFSRLWMGYWFAYALTAMFVFRWLLMWLFKRFQLGRLLNRKVLIVGAGEFARSVAEKARGARDARWKVKGFVITNGSCAAVEGDPAPKIALGDMDSHIASQHGRIDELWIAMEDDELDQRAPVIELLQSSCLPVRYIPDLSVLALLNHMASQVAGMTAIDLNASPLTGYNRFIKSLFDKLFAITALLLLSPLLVLIAVLVKLDSPGPIFFRQQRHGWDGKMIQILKFRTMRRDGSVPDGSSQARKNDPRITRIGRRLRRTSLDELPQFINVLRGEMSVVGPRPHPVALNKNYMSRIDTYMQRHRVKPGITGWAQINGLRGQTDTLEQMQQRIEHDLYYIQHWSLWLDMKIIALTLFGGWTGRNAY